MKNERKKRFISRNQFLECEGDVFLFGIPVDGMSVPPEFAYVYTVIYTKEERRFDLAQADEHPKHIISNSKG
jgi:hypothetical protein